jgi:uncharacterized protein DUF1579
MTMKMLCASAAFLLAAALSAQETKKEEPKKAEPKKAEHKKAPAAKKQETSQAASMPMVKPGPEHDLLKKDVGTWDATVEMMATPEAPASTSKGVETSKMLGGLWLVTDFKSQMMGQPFQGHGTTGYYTNKKKYVGTWVDTMSTGLMTGESTYDPATKTVTGYMEGTDPATGKPTKMKMVTEYKDDNSRVFTMYMTGPDGKEAAAAKK